MRQPGLEPGNPDSQVNGGGVSGSQGSHLRYTHRHHIMPALYQLSYKRLGFWATKKRKRGNQKKKGLLGSMDPMSTLSQNGYGDHMHLGS